MRLLCVPGCSHCFTALHMVAGCGAELGSSWTACSACSPTHCGNTARAHFCTEPRFCWSLLSFFPCDLY